MRKRVAITGACGRIAQRIIPGLADPFDLTLLDIRTTAFDGTPVDGVQTCVEAAVERAVIVFRDQIARITGGTGA